MSESKFSRREPASPDALPAGSNNGVTPGLTQGLLRPVLVSAVFFMLVTGVAYPLLATGAAKLLFPRQAEGSLVVRDGQAVGSAVVGQNFVKPEYFHPRPSATQGPDPQDASKSVASPYNAGMSGASNWGPTNKKLVDAVAERVSAYRADNGLAANALVPVDAVTASASGLDPDISVANARLQTARVARVRGLPLAGVEQLVSDSIQGRVLGLLGEERVNVLQLNLALDALQRTAGQPRKS